MLSAPEYALPEKQGNESRLLANVRPLPDDMGRVHTRSVKVFELSALPIRSELRSMGQISVPYRVNRA
jgi:hypothetical protein